LAGVQQRLGRDAAAVQAGAAQLVPLDDRDRQPQFGSPEGRGVAAAAGAQDNDVVLTVRCAHVDSPRYPAVGVIAAILSLRSGPRVTRCTTTPRFGVPFAPTDGASPVD